MSVNLSPEKFHLLFDTRRFQLYFLRFLLYQGVADMKHIHGISPTLHENCAINMQISVSVVFGEGIHDCDEID